MDRKTTQGPNMRLPLRPAPAPPNATTNGSSRRADARPPLQRQLTSVGFEWVSPWDDIQANHNASQEAYISHSMSTLQLGGDQEMNTRKKRTPPPRPPPPCFNKNKQSHAGNGSRNTQKSSSSGFLSAIFNLQQRPARRTGRDGGNRQPNNGKSHRQTNSSRQKDIIPWEKRNQNHRPGNNAALSGVIKNSSSAPSKLNENHPKTDSPPPLLDLLTSSPPSSPVPSSRFGGSTGADTDSLSSDGLSKVGPGNTFASAFPLEDDPFDPFGEMMNGGMPSSDPWGGDDPFSPVPAPRRDVSSNALEDPWSSSSTFNPPNFFSQNSSTTVNASATGMMRNSSSLPTQEDWPTPAVRSTTSSPLGSSSVWYTSNASSSNRHDSNSVVLPSARNLNSINGSSSSRPALPCEIPRTMNLAILGAMPTIIRAKPKPKERSRLESVAGSEELLGNSPPMPSVPPPPPPPSTLLDDWDGGGGLDEAPDLPPRPWKDAEDNSLRENVSSSTSERSRDSPHGIALFDYPATQADDLAFQTGELILLIRKINDDWYFGQRESGGKPGMFPSSFIRPVIDIPLESSSDNNGQSWDINDGASAPSGRNCLEDNRTVKALYTFTPEVAEDLEFEEGALIEVTAQLDSEWLWGHIGQKWGQFPASFVDRVPKFLPQHQP